MSFQECMARICLGALSVLMVVVSLPAPEGKFIGGFILICAARFGWTFIDIFKESKP